MKQLRLSVRLTQQQVADSLHVTRGAVAQWEAGLTKPSIDLLVPLSRLYLVSLERLVEILTAA